MSWRALPEILAGSRVFIQTHDFPDPDAIASAYGLQYLLRGCGIEAQLCCRGGIERASMAHIIRTYDIRLQEQSHIREMDERDKIVLVDGQKFNANMMDLPGDEVACIDHHPTFAACEYQYKDIRQVGACSSIIAEYFLRGGVPLDTATATILLYGLQVDTDSMTRGVAELDLEMFSFLYRLADHDMLDMLAAKSLEFSDLKAFGAAIENIRVFGRAGFAGIPFACPDPLIAQVADFILSLAEVDVAVIYSRRPDGIKLSARSTTASVHSGNMLAEVLADIGSGGGHARMAGGFVPTDRLDRLGADDALRDACLQHKFLEYLHAHLVKTPEQ